MTRTAAPPPTEIAFETSGTTGTPVTWLRTPEQLRAEAELLVATVGRMDRVVSFAPPHHLYGRIFGVEIPRLLGVPATLCWQEVLVPRVLDPSARTLLVCLPSTWQLLLHQLPTLAACRQVIAVHSTARATDAAYEVARRLTGTGFQGWEVLGSTETGAVATRPIRPAPDPGARDHGEWRLLPDVVRRDPAPGSGGGALTVGGPRLARRPGAPAPAALTMPDLVVPTGPRTFRLTGRVPGLVKVNGVRCDLRQVERAVRAVLPDADADAACVPVADEVRGEHYTLYYASAGGPAPGELRSRLAGALGSVPGPRWVVRVRRIPRSGDTVLTTELPGLAVAAR
ncbi:AMP-binding protein [Streptomyces sp. NPDC020965]|uniref:AMP-binding protein n=1 Tax=Streptomyces sp. NPDC020965 TaxID=3365105 RepID=UPI003790B346